MTKFTATGFLIPLLFLFGLVSDNPTARAKQREPETQTLQKLIVSGGNVVVDLDLDRLAGTSAPNDNTNRAQLHFTIAPDSFFTVTVFNDLLRGPQPGSLGLIAQDTTSLPSTLAAALQHLTLEKSGSSDAFDLFLRDEKNRFFNIEGHEYDFDASRSLFTIKGGRLLVSKEFANRLGLPLEGHAIGTISVTANLLPVEIKTLVNGDVTDAVMPSVRNRILSGDPSSSSAPTLVAGPDVIVGDVISVEQPTGTQGINGSFVGLGVGTLACNAGDQQFHWFANPNNDHPLITQNLYRMSGGLGSNERFEQIGQGWPKHSFAANEEDACNYGCNTTGCTVSTNLCAGCSDPYSANLNYAQTFLGSRAWVNPFTGNYPRGDSATPPLDHTGHNHTGTSHRVTVAMSDLTTSGAAYFGEGHYVTPHEEAWCLANPGQCNMYNNVSYRQFAVSTSDGLHFSFPPVASTVRTQPALMAWTGATINQVEPAPGTDGIGFVACKVTSPIAGTWHYEYAVYNENLDRSIQFFTVPLGPGMTISNIGFHAPPQEPGFAADGTVGNTGYSSAPWTSNLTSTELTWSSETFAQNPNANAIRWGTLYNFRFDSNRPPQAASATIGFFKTGSPMPAGIQAPSPGPTPTPTPFGATPTPSPIPTASPTPTPTPTPTPVTMVSLPVASVDVSATNFSQPLATTAVNSGDNLTGFQGDLTFDETVVTFQNPPISNAGLTSGNWTLTGNILPGPGPIRTLHLSASSNDSTPLSGSGTLCNLNLTRVTNTLGASTALTWAASPANFVFIDNVSNAHPPAAAPAGSVTIHGIIVSGTIRYCTNPSSNPIPNVLLTLSGSGSGAALSDGTGNYSLITLASGGTYSVTPSKTPLPPISLGINTIDVLAVQRHFLSITPIPAGCRLSAADANGDSSVNTIDVIAIQRFYLGLATGFANVGKYQFNPVNRNYPGVVTNQSGQDYNAFIYGDVASPYAVP